MPESSASKLLPALLGVSEVCSLLAVLRARPAALALGAVNFCAKSCACRSFWRMLPPLPECLVLLSSIDAVSCTKDTRTSDDQQRCYRANSESVTHESGHRGVAASAAGRL